MGIRRYTKEDEQTIIDLFYKLKDNSSPSIKRVTGFGISKIDKVLTEHLDARLNVKDIEVKEPVTLKSFK